MLWKGKKKRNSTDQQLVAWWAFATGLLRGLLMDIVPLTATTMSRVPPSVEIWVCQPLGLPRDAWILWRMTCVYIIWASPSISSMTINQLISRIFQDQVLPCMRDTCTKSQDDETIPGQKKEETITLESAPSSVQTSHVHHCLRRSRPLYMFQLLQPSLPRALHRLWMQMQRP